MKKRWECSIGEITFLAKLAYSTILVGFHPATRSVQSTPADNTRKRVWQYIEKERKRKDLDLDLHCLPMAADEKALVDTLAHLWYTGRRILVKKARFVRISLTVGGQRPQRASHATHYIERHAKACRSCKIAPKTQN